MKTYNITNAAPSGWDITTVVLAPRVRGRTHQNREEQDESNTILNGASKITVVTIITSL